jgi:hypothetical protein
MDSFKTEKVSFSAPSGFIGASLLSVANSSDEIAVVFPGAGSPWTAPLLNYSIDALLLKGYQVLAIDKLYAEDGNSR